MADKKHAGFTPIEDLPAPKPVVPAPPQAPGMAGRPSIYTEAMAAEICQRLASGESLRSICRDDHMPDEKTVRTWAIDPDHPISPQYALARAAQAERWAEEIVEISDDGSNDWMQRETESGRMIEVVDHEHISRSKLRVDTRKWLMSKLLPKRYGDSARVEHTGADGKDLQPAALPALEQAKILAHALEIAARRLATPGDGAKVIEVVSDEAGKPEATVRPGKPE